MAPEERDPLAAALDSVGDRWTLQIVAALLDGPRRFGDLQEEVGGIAPNVLTQRLRRLEEDGLAIAQPYSERPPRYVYELSESGRGLAAVLRLLSDWGARHSGAEPPRHAACGTALEAVWYCPTCETPVEPGEAGEDLHYA
jgi:DNA-binding HxlR family transcriptional regulator